MSSGTTICIWDIAFPKKWTSCFDFFPFLELFFSLERSPLSFIYRADRSSRSLSGRFSSGFSAFCQHLFSVLPSHLQNSQCNVLPFTLWYLTDLSVVAKVRAVVSIYEETFSHLKLSMLWSQITECVSVFPFLFSFKLPLLEKQEFAVKTRRVLYTFMSVVAKYSHVRSEASFMLSTATVDSREHLISIEADNIGVLCEFGMLAYFPVF